MMILALILMFQLIAAPTELEQEHLHTLYVHERHMARQVANDEKRLAVSASVFSLHEQAVIQEEQGHLAMIKKEHADYIATLTKNYPGWVANKQGDRMIQP